MLSGGLMLARFSWRPITSTSPVTPRGQIIFGIGCGLLTVFIRYFGGLPERRVVLILIMNTLVWAMTRPPIPQVRFAALDKKKEAQ